MREMKRLGADDTAIDRLGDVIKDLDEIYEHPKKLFKLSKVMSKEIEQK